MENNINNSGDFNSELSKKVHIYFGHLYDQRGKRVPSDELVKWITQWIPNDPNIKREAEEKAYTALFETISNQEMNLSWSLSRIKELETEMEELKAQSA